MCPPPKGGVEEQMAKPVAVTDATFQKEVLEADKPVLTDFWAAWCGPCKRIAPVLEELAGEMSDNLKIAKVDVDANQGTMMKYNIMAIPTLLLFKNGKVVAQMVGFKNKEDLVRTLQPHLA